LFLLEEYHLFMIAVGLVAAVYNGASRYTFYMTKSYTKMLMQELEGVEEAAKKIGEGQKKDE